MNIEHHDHEAGDLDHYRNRVHQLGTQIVAVRAVVNSGEPNWRRRCEDAAAALRSLLSLPVDRPGAWEAGHVEALDDQLRDMLRILDGGSDRRTAR